LPDAGSRPRGRLCVWCGAAADSAEHVWPQWIAKYLPHIKHIKAPHLVVVEAEGQEQAVESRGERVAFTTKVRCVCKSCNTGWMHELETTAEPILAPLIQGKAGAWHQWRQTVAATWAMKTAIMVEQASAPELRAIPNGIFPGFQQILRPPLPPYLQVWTAAYAGPSPHFYGRAMLRLELTADGVAVPNDLTAYGACLQIGALTFRLFGHIIKDGPINVPDADIARCLVPIWPVSPRAEWPPELAVDDDGIELLVKSMGDIPPPVPIRPPPQSESPTRRD
jgi:hypothetical protein